MTTCVPIEPVRLTSFAMSEASVVAGTPIWAAAQSTGSQSRGGGELADTGVVSSVHVPTSRAEAGMSAQQFESQDWCCMMCAPVGLACSGCTHLHRPRLGNASVPIRNRVRNMAVGAGHRPLDAFVGVTEFSGGGSWGVARLGPRRRRVARVVAPGARGAQRCRRAAEQRRGRREAVHLGTDGGVAHQHLGTQGAIHHEHSPTNASTIPTSRRGGASTITGAPS